MIEEIYEKTNQKTVIVTHSLGSKWILYLLNNCSQEWKDTYINSWISISPIYKGSPKILKLIVSGDNEGIPYVDGF